MREFLSLAILPVPLLILLLLAAFFFLWIKKRKSGKLLLIISGLWFLVITTRPVPLMIVVNLEKKYPQLNDSLIKALPDSCDIIILGGGHSDDPSLSPNNQLSPAALVRLVEAIRIHNQVPGSRIILSGFGGRSKLPQAVVLYRTAIMLGVDSSSMVLSEKPGNTASEAKEYVRNFANGKRLILVTCAIHMPRSVLLFREAGIEPIPAPTNFLVKHGSVKNHWRWVPSAGYIEMMELAIHECVGLMWSWLGWK
jgi:uncharacterized SAM-binding protein YcdF (DUF218 family)